MKNAFYFTLKALFVLKVFQFFSCFFGHVEKHFDEKDNNNLKNYDVTFSKQTIAIHSLFNIANIHILETNNCNTLIVQYCKYKDNQTIKFGQLIEKNMRNIYDMKNNMKNHTQNVVEKVFPDLILKYQN